MVTSRTALSKELTSQDTAFKTDRLRYLGIFSTNLMRLHSIWIIPLCGMLLATACSKSLTRLQLLQFDCDRNNDYTITVTGEVQNTGEVTFQVLALIGVFRDDEQRVIDTNTLIIDKINLPPGERAAFKLVGRAAKPIEGTCEISMRDMNGPVAFESSVPISVPFSAIE